MRKIKRLTVVLISISLLTMNAVAQGGHMYVKVQSENIRNAPKGEKTGELLAGTKVEILERRPNWVKVQYTGWIWESSLTNDSTMVQGFTMGAKHILVKTEAEALRILKEIKNGSDFDELARKYSIDVSSGSKGGNLGLFHRGDLLPDFEAAILRLKVGELSGVVKTSLGYHIIQRTK
jgi:hypothetical protein